jgi:hypothetical protein
MTLLLIAVSAALALLAGTAVATSSGTIRIHSVRVPDRGVAKPVDMAMATPYETSVSTAEAELGFHVQTLAAYPIAKTPVKMPGGRIQSIVFHPPVTAIDGRPIVHNTGAVGLYYTVHGTNIEIVEQMDPRGPGPLDVVLKQPGREDPRMPTIGIETIGGAEYLVSRSKSNRGIVMIEWKTTDGVLMRINCDRPLSTDLVASLIRHLA